MDVKERRPYCSLTKSRREKERRYTNSSADNEECRVPTQKSYSSSETLKAFDHDSSRLLYGNRVKDLVHREADEYSRQGSVNPVQTVVDNIGYTICGNPGTDVLGDQIVVLLSSLQARD
ncbi:hypothetical protein GHT09_005267 [Marmota monax]|uniref:Teneurin N-terminal domain-containing protein n=1 Tax=Marmota monax TaxID=9995 RepID=A0A834QS44_MARMO|nr:hypothetical protein GHT09_005267 [Marmota monax]